MKSLKRFLNLLFGIKIKLKPTFSNGGESDHTWIVASCHPKKSITWVWALYCSTPKLSIKWMLRPGFHMSKQKPMWEGDLK